VCVCVCVCECMFGHNSGTPGAISTKLGTRIAICMCNNLMYVLYIYISPKHQSPKVIWMIHVVEEIKLLLLLSNRMVMTSRLATVGQTYPRKHIVSAKM
jgi:pyrrolidone-carboxylate peptidase